MDIRQVTPGDAAMLRSIWELETTARRFDVPALPTYTVDEVVNEVAVTRSRVRERWVAVDGDRVVGGFRLNLPQLDNHTVAELSLVVHPEHRRRGIGTALLEVALRRSREEGRTHVTGEVPESLVDGVHQPGERLAAGAGFASAAGAKPALDEMCRVLDLHTIDEDRLAALAAEAESRSSGYETVRWVGPAPEELLPAMAHLTSRLSTDAPMGDLEWGEETWDAERYREAEAEAAAMGRHWVTTAARHVETGQLVAYTDIGYVRTNPEPAFQWTTIVEGTHRGHRLGMLIKLANLDLLRRDNPLANRIYTWNADSNDHMLAINLAMGFQPVAKFTEWQLHLS